LPGDHEGRPYEEIIVYHHEMTERLAWRPSQRRELILHGMRNLIYAVLFILLGWFEPHGVWAALIIRIASPRPA
jgi:hypothetical protein